MKYFATFFSAVFMAMVLPVSAETLEPVAAPPPPTQSQEKLFVRDIGVIKKIAHTPGTQLQDAVWTRQYHKVAKLVKEGADPNEIKGWLRHDALFYDACDKDMVELILEYGSPVSDEHIGCAKGMLLNLDENNRKRAKWLEENKGHEHYQTRQIVHKISLKQVDCLVDLLDVLRDDVDAITPKDCGFLTGGSCSSNFNYTTQKYLAPICSNKW